MDDTDSPPFHPDSPVLDDEGNPLPYDKPGHDEKKEEEEDSEEEGEGEGEEMVSMESKMDLRTVSQHRKAFVKWVNEEFYPRVVKSDSDSPLKVYQKLVQNYLALQTPYRGLLVYHGLGTGKTASAVSLAEGLSSQLKITTLLPASLETEFIKEVRHWGLRELHLKQKWCHRPFKDMSKEELTQLGSLYGLNGAVSVKILKKAKASYKKRLIQDSGESDTSLEKQIRVADKHLVSLKGFWIPEGSPLAKGPAKLYRETLEGQESASEDTTWGPIESEYILQQVNFLISKKYNFIHYRPFPKVETTSLEAFQEVEEDDDEDPFPEETQEAKTHNQKIVKRLEKALSYNRKHYDIDSPFHREVVIIDEVHNLVRQIVNRSKPSLVFYEWLINARDIKLVCLSGTPYINKPCEIATLYNMICGKIRVFTFTMKTKMSPEEMTASLQEIIYEKPSPIELFFVEQNQGKLVISFIQESTGFESMRDDKGGKEGKEDVIYTMQTRDSSFEEFIEAIYVALHEASKGSKGSKESIKPSHTEFKALKVKERREIYRGVTRVFDTELQVPFTRHQKLFDVYENGVLTDMSENEDFVRYFFESGDTIPSKKRVLLRRMLMGMTSYYPIDRSSIVDMPQIVPPTLNADIYRDYAIVKEMNIVPCYMSQLQFEKYHEVIEKEKAWDKSKQGQMSDDQPWHYHTRTRQACNIVFQNDDFRIMKKTKLNEQSLEDEKQRVYQGLRESQALRMDRDLSKVSPKMYQMLLNMKTFRKGATSTGKILFYSDFRGDAGSEAFELVLQSNGYERFDTMKPQETPGLRYTFITGSESPEERRINKEYYNEEKNMRGEYIQIMIISSAGAEGLSLTCVRQVHLLEPYWNYVRIDQVLGRAIRMRSHLLFKDKKDRNVEQFLYLSVLPPGTTLDSVFESIRDLETWSVPDWSDVKAELAKTENRSYKELFDDIVNLNINDKGQSTDQYLFQVMESKYRMSIQMSEILKESSIDCIPHTKDDPQLNDRCIRFSDLLAGEIAYFPGISAHVLDKIDVMQLRATTLEFLPPDIYVISAKSASSVPLYLYYRYELQGTETREEIDVRYLRENALKLAEVNVSMRMVSVYAERDHPHNARLGKEFSVYQEIYRLDDSLLDEYLLKERFPPYSKLIQERWLQGYNLKYNVTNAFYYLEKNAMAPNHLLKIYPFQEYRPVSSALEFERPLFIYQGSLYIKD